MKYDLEGICQDCMYLEKIKPLFEEKNKELDIAVEIINNKQKEIVKLSEKIREKDKKIDWLNDLIKISERYLELIADLGYDYDGFSKSEDLKTLIDELVRYASLGRVYNTTDCIYVNGDKKYNILNEEIEDNK